MANLQRIAAMQWALGSVNHLEDGYLIECMHGHRIPHYLGAIHIACSKVKSFVCRRIGTLVCKTERGDRSRNGLAPKISIPGVLINNLVLYPLGHDATPQIVLLHP